MEKLNIAEILKDCPKGMELDCTMYDNVTFEGIKDVGYINILIKTPNGIFELSKNGCYHFHPNAKCVIFPKGKTTWEGFHRPFKDGDVVYIQSLYEYIVIYKETNCKNLYKYAAICISFNNRLLSDNNILCYEKDIKKIRFATEEEKQKLFDVIKANGYKWYPETKTLEKLIVPKFKVGDRIKNKYIHKNDCAAEYTIRKVHTKCYKTDLGILPFENQDDYELVPDKFDISTLKPFDKVLVRDSNTLSWTNSFYSNYNVKDDYPFYCIDYGKFKQCIPYEGNEHLLGKTDSCDDYYKTWE